MLAEKELIFMSQADQVYDVSPPLFQIALTPKINVTCVKYFSVPTLPTQTILQGHPFRSICLLEEEKCGLVSYL